MYGWRARVGFVLPSRGDTLIREFYKVAPDGAVAVPYALNLRQLQDDELARVRSAYQVAVEQMNFEQVDIICVCGSPPLLSQGPDGYAELAASLQANSDVPVVSGPQVEAEAIAAGGSQAPTVITPFEDVLNDRFSLFLKTRGVSVHQISGLGIKEAFKISLVHAPDLYRHVIKLTRGGADLGDGVHFTCPRWPTIEILQPLEQVLGVPVTASAQAIIWSTLGRLHVIDDGIADTYGSLFSRPTPGSD